MRILVELIRHPLVYLGAAVSVVGAAVRLAAIERNLSFDELVAELRRPGRWPTRISTPLAQARVTGRLLPILPPRRMGPCMKRSLVLLQLWSAWGLAPRLHLGVRYRDDQQREGHAWLTVEDPELSRMAGAPVRGCPESMVL